MLPFRNTHQDADDNVGSIFGPVRRRLRSVGDSIDAQLRAIEERDHARRCASAWKALSRASRREIGYLERELHDAEARAKDAEHRATVANHALAISAERVDAAEARIRDLDSMVNSLLIERHRTQHAVEGRDADIAALREEIVALTTRARNAERCCMDKDFELIKRFAENATLEAEAEQARGQLEAERIMSAAAMDVEDGRCKHWEQRASDAEAACRDATAALVEAEAEAERARECVPSGIAGCRDEDVAAEFAKRFEPSAVEFCGRYLVFPSHESLGSWASSVVHSGSEVRKVVDHGRILDAIVHAKRRAEGR
jgi:hypothetical protein